MKSTDLRKALLFCQIGKCFFCQDNRVSFCPLYDNEGCQGELLNYCYNQLISSFERRTKKEVLDIVYSDSDDV